MKKILPLLITFNLFGLTLQKEKDQENIFTQHKENYIAVGDKQSDTILQFSWKASLFTSKGWLSKFYFAYTQKMFWRLIYTQSSPFDDVNYNPQLFYSLDFRSIGFDFGFIEHLSNGQAGESSRTLDSSYIKIKNQLVLGSLSLLFENKFYGIYNAVDNRDIVEYIGYWKSRLTIDLFKDFAGIINKESLFIEINPPARFDFRRLNIQAGLAIRTMTKLKWRFFIAYFNGYGETILRYNTRQHAVRFGLRL
jgi:phospholipase A1